MRIRAVVQRYGAEVAGGAESFCRSMSTRLAARGQEFVHQSVIVEIVHSRVSHPSLGVRGDSNGCIPI